MKKYLKVRREVKTTSRVRHLEPKRNMDSNSRRTWKQTSYACQPTDHIDYPFTRTRFIGIDSSNLRSSIGNQTDRTSECGTSKLQSTSFISYINNPIILMLAWGADINRLSTTLFLFSSNRLVPDGSNGNTEIRSGRAKSDVQKRFLKRRNESRILLNMVQTKLRKNFTKLEFHYLRHSSLAKL